MKVYVVEVDNGYMYSDRDSWVEGVFKSYRGASQYLINEGFIPYARLNYFNEYVLNFAKPMDKSKYKDKEEEGYILEFDLINDKKGR